MSDAQGAIEKQTFEGASADERLASLGLSRTVLAEIVRRGEMARMDATPHDPVSAASWDAYRHRVRATRDLLCISQWKPKFQDGLELTVAPDGTHQIMTRGGFSGVGQPDADPQPTRELGGAAERVAVTNSNLFPDKWFAQKARDGTSKVRGKGSIPAHTWVLLVQRVGDLVFAELSLPSRLDDRSAEWRERIILPAVDYSAVEPADETASQSDDDDVMVSKKQ